jgi:hypothetical protein
VRGYFAAVNRAAQTPVLFDPAEQGSFSLDAPPAPWISLGWIEDFSRRPVSKTSALMTGIPAAPLEQVRETLGAQVSVQFLSWTKLTMALATGSQHMNLLLPAQGATPAADGAQAAAAVVVQSGSTATSIVLATADAAKFSAGQMVAVDVDYTGQSGFVGSPVSGAYLRAALTDVDYVRRVTFNVALVASVSTTGLALAEGLPGGAPATGMKMQALSGFVDREGGSFYQEWSALFVVEGSQGERVFFHYPRLQSMASAEEISQPLEAKGRNSLERVLLRGQYLALPVTDPLDGERVVCYRSFLPAANALV